MGLELGSVSPVIGDQRKRVKDTSGGAGITPGTLKAQPPKQCRPDVGRKLLFSQPSCSDGKFHCKSSYTLNNLLHYPSVSA